jgi:hypothetical protein
VSKITVNYYLYVKLVLSESLTYFRCLEIVELKEEDMPVV